MNDSELLRYSRHILLPQIDIDGQEAIRRGRALVVGVGGLGSPVSLYLAASGIGALTLVDDDVVDISNLQRQVIHGEQTLGMKKVSSAARALKEINSDVEVVALEQRLDRYTLDTLLDTIDVVIDCSDNVETRRMVNHACIAARCPLVFGAAIRFEGQICVFDFRRPESPCYECLFGMLGEQPLNCSQSGVFSPLVGVLGSMQALEALKLLAGVDLPPRQRLGIFDGYRNDWRYIEFTRDKNCHACKPQA